jgi:glycosyltransferase involved in cell wall biosynthesis
MKLAHVETGMHLYGGAQQVAYLLDGLGRRGVHNLLVCPPGAAIGAAFLGHPMVKVLETPCSGDADLGFILRLRRLLAEERPDLVHLHSRRGADVLGGLAARWAGVPAVLSRRVDNPESRFAASIKYPLYERVICISEGIAAVLRAEGVATSRLRVVRSAVDPAPWAQPEPRDAFLREFGFTGEAPVIGVVAQLIERKGHRYLFEALARIGAAQDWRLLVLGQGPERQPLEALAKELQIGPRVSFAGFRKDLPRWLGNLDLLVHPALMEGLGVSLLQASAAGVPIIASRAGGIPEAVREGENGLLVEPADVDGLTAALRRLLADPAERRRLGDDGRRLIAREFSTETMVDGNLEIYRRLLGYRAAA